MSTILYENVQNMDHKTLWSKIEPYVAKSKDDVTEKKKKFDYYIYEIIRKVRNYNNHQAGIVFSYIQKLISKYTTDITINSYTVDMPHNIVYFSVDVKSKKARLSMDELWNNVILPKVQSSGSAIPTLEQNFYFMDRRVKRLYARYTGGNLNAAFLKTRRKAHIEMLNIMIIDAGIKDVKVTGIKPRRRDIYYVVETV